MSLSFVFLPTVEFLGMLATASCSGLAGWPSPAATLTLGVVVAFLAYVTRFFQPIQELSQLYTTMQAAMAGGERVLELLDTEPEVADPPDAIEMPPIDGRVELRDVSFSYRGEAHGAARHQPGPSSRGRPWRWWARPAPARRPSPTSSPASTT